MAAKSEAELKALINDELMPEYDSERVRLNKIDKWARWAHEDFTLPRKATKEHRALREMSKAPWLGQIVNATAQCMFVDGYRSKLDLAGTADATAQFEMEDGPYGIWLANGWDSRQIAVHRAMLTYGFAYATCLPGEDFQGKPMPVLRGVSPRQMVALYADPSEDDWPEIAMRVIWEKGTKQSIKVYDEAYVYEIELDSSIKPGAEPFTLVDTKAHGAGVVPVVRYCKELDLDGRTKGEIEPYIALAMRINKTSYDRMLVQHWNSWKIRWIAGMAQPDLDEATLQKEKLKLAQDDLLIAADADTKFGTMAETGMADFIAAHQNDIETLSAVSQTPTHELTGQMVNLSAEALAAARASQTQKVHEIQKYAGHAHVQLLRLACKMAGMQNYATDISGRVTWQDTSIQSLAAAVDALGKAAVMLEVPFEVLWARIPGVEKADVLEWIKLRAQQQEIQAKKDLQTQKDQLALAQAGKPPVNPVNPVVKPSGKPGTQPKPVQGRPGVPKPPQTAPKAA